MSEQAPERSSSGGNVFTRKIGPLSMWVWMLIALILAIVYYLYKKNSSSSANTAATAAAGNAPGGVDSSLVPQFINQTYVNSEPPVAPNVTVNNTVPLPPPPLPGGNTNVPAPPSTTPTTPKSQPPTPAKPPTEPIFNGTYRVKAGQTLQDVASQFGITREQLAHANGLGTGAGLRTGQVLRVPNPAPAGKPNKAQ